MSRFLVPRLQLKEWRGTGDDAGDDEKGTLTITFRGDGDGREREQEELEEESWQM